VKRADAGFTLLEVIVALAILSLAVVAAIQGFAQGLRLLKLAGDHQRAMLLADEKAREVVDPEEGREQGTEGNFRWERQTTVIPAPDLVPTVGVPRWRIYEIDVKVFWDERRQVEINMLRTMPLTVVATTPQQFDLLQADYEVPVEKCRMIPPGYDDNRFFPVSEASRNAIRQRLNFSGKVVLAIGRLARNKGYDLLINGFQLAAEREAEAKLRLAVGGADLNDAEQRILDELKEQVARLKLEDRVLFEGFIPDELLADYYRAADLFVLSSRYEPFGMTAIEAMASGTPTVVTVHGGLYRALTFGRHALYADPFDKEDLGITMFKVLRHPRLRDRLARMGAHKARSLFTWTGIAQQLVSLIESRATALAFTDNDWDEPWNDGD